MNKDNLINSMIILFLCIDPFSLPMVKVPNLKNIQVLNLLLSNKLSGNNLISEKLEGTGHEH